ncbi:hypothetical protein [Spirosoma endophyticum]|uniref:Uncharacterized protein n=1 Tax=Spirosoma endophyticum TaxID=662367 RepID=A0A1I2H8I6_9BACT|nr:hypothetical protein [Spirosoma endophyticum]SFF24931.1 hypothetical protein SAMN05216167_13818 [Spirosoma endophyticum]
MNRVIAPGDWVIVTPVKNGITRKSYKATAIAWMSSGKLKVQPDGDKRQMSKLVNSDDVKKLADKPTQ